MKSNSSKPMTAVPLILALGMSAAMMGGAGTALAAPAPGDVVQYGDLNTATPAGVHELSDRIENAAWQLCLNVAPPSGGPGDIDNVRCQQAVIGEAVARINNPMLTQMHPGVPAVDDVRNG